MKKYIVELWECVEVEAENKWEAFDKAWELYDAGEVEITEADIVTCEDID